MSYFTSLAFICKGTCSCDEPELIDTAVSWTHELVHSPSCPQYVHTYLLTLSHHDDQIRHIVEDFDLPHIWGDIELQCVQEYHCNGLICLTNGMVSEISDIILCNPIINMYRFLPDPDLLCFATLGGG